MAEEKSSNNTDGADAEYEEEEPTIQINLQNFVATVNLGCKLNLDTISQTARNAEYNPTRFQAVIMRIREPRTTALIFASGKMIVTGAKKREDCEMAARKYQQIIRRIDFPAEFNDFKIQNITATVDVGFPIRLEGFMYTYSANCTYEPELFPGLVYRMTDPRVVLLIFVSGKVVVTGAKSQDDIISAIENIMPKLMEFRKRNIIIP